jgi:redox-sensitive bicupin YhaK (pirin superfamily)
MELRPVHDGKIFRMTGYAQTAELPKLVSKWSLFPTLPASLHPTLPALFDTVARSSVFSIDALFIHGATKQQNEFQPNRGDNMESFVLKAEDRGYDKLLSVGGSSSYVAGHPDAFITRHSSFNFGDYQTGRKGFGKMRVFGEETFSHAGCGYNMHPHHDFIIMAFILAGELTHVNTLGKVDSLKAGDYYAFSAGSGGKHCELNIEQEDLHVIYVWVLPDMLLLPPTYQRAHFDAAAARNKVIPLVGGSSAMSIHQDLTISRLDSDVSGSYEYKLRSTQHGAYLFVVEGSTMWNGVSLGKGDSAGFWSTEETAFQTGAGKTDILIVETVM